ncbi:hypothetical protein LZ554_004662 [Drepanopeziza brunnea f. sp. 'monogermtubi']|nr:hypothetical protein LZ554_004662 [Drepanopeziza brunnea f. sp. 'monogermtubi']
MGSSPSRVGPSQSASIDTITRALDELNFENHPDEDQENQPDEDQGPPSNADNSRDIGDAALRYHRPAWKAHHSRRRAHLKARQQASGQAGKQRQRFESAKRRAELYRSMVMMTTGIIREQRKAVQRLRKHWHTIHQSPDPSPEDIAAYGGGNVKVSQTCHRISTLLMLLKSEIEYTNRIRNRTIRITRRMERHIRSHA